MDKSAFYTRILAALSVAAFGLHLILTEWGTQHVTVYGDGHSEITMGPAGKVIFPFERSFADAVCIAGQPCVRAFDTVSGLFVRGNTPWGIAVLGGVAIPFVLLCYSAYRLKREISFQLGSKSAIGAVILGVLLLIPPVDFLSRYYRSIFSNWMLSQFPLLGGMIALGLTLLFIGVRTLWGRSK
jgi:hypothetical protein